MQFTNYSHRTCMSYFINNVQNCLTTYCKYLKTKFVVPIDMSICADLGPDTQRNYISVNQSSGHSNQTTLLMG